MPSSPQDIDTALALPRDRVRDHSAQIVNRRIAERTRDRIDRVVHEGRDAIARRLQQLDDEWDVDRALMVNFAILGGASYAAGLYRYSHRPWFGRRRKGWLQFFTVQLGFLLYHGTVGWCPPLAVFRRLGVRTKSEIEAERRALLDAQRSLPMPS
jgi:hypothetical protein